MLSTKAGAADHLLDAIRVDAEKEIEHMRLQHIADRKNQVGVRGSRACVRVWVPCVRACVGPVWVLH